MGTLKAAFDVESRSKMMGNTLVIEEKQDGNPSLIRRKFDKLRTCLKKIEDGVHMQKQEIQSTIYLITELLPMLKKKEQAYLQKMYKKIKPVAKK